MSSTTATDTDIDPAALTKAVQDSHSQAAPTDPNAVLLAQHAALLARIMSLLPQIQAFMGQYGPALDKLVNDAASAVIVSEPAAAPAVARLEALESWALSVIDHFQGKIPVLPPPPAA